jgi:mannose-6-phosphate isomerase-like protein (cupin superfamily)
MTDVNQYMESGILEQYVLGNTDPLQTSEVELMAASHPAIRMEIEAISDALEAYAMENAIDANPIVKPFLVATIDFTERLQHGEPITAPPILNEKSVVGDYAAWLNREDMVSTGSEDLYAKIIGFTPEAITAIVWIKDYAPQEVHDHEYERFLIVEGTCNIIVGDEVNELVPGNYFAIPLHKDHMVKVTSSIPCKVILQRVAA